MKDKFWDILETIFSNILKLYKTYFLHWTVTRFLIALYSIGVVFVFVLIPLGVFLLSFIGLDTIRAFILYFQQYGVALQAWQRMAAGAIPAMPHLSIGIIGAGVAIWFIGIVVACIGLGYANTILIIKAYKGYIEDKPLDYAQNTYFSWPYIWKYILLKLIQMGIFFAWALAVAVVVGVILAASSLVAWGIGNFGQNIGAWAIILFVLLGIFALCVSIYVSLRFCLADVLLADTDNIDLPAFEYIKRSWYMTKDRAGWIFLISFIAGLAISIASGMISGILGFIPYLWGILNFVATGYVSSMVIISIYLSLKKMDMPVLVEESEKLENPV